MGWGKGWSCLKCLKWGGPAGRCTFVDAATAGGGGTCLGARLHSLICYDVIHAVSPSSLRGIYPMGELGAGLHLQDRLSGHYTSCPMTASNLIETLCGQWIHSSTIISQVSPSPPSYSFISRYSETATLKPLDGERYHFKAFNS